jgi:hypothetical protein
LWHRSIIFLTIYSFNITIVLSFLSRVCFCSLLLLLWLLPLYYSWHLFSHIQSSIFNHTTYRINHWSTSHQLSNLLFFPIYMFYKLFFHYIYFNCRRINNLFLHCLYLVKLWFKLLFLLFIWFLSLSKCSLKKSKFLSHMLKWVFNLRLTHLYDK